MSSQRPLLQKLITIIEPVLEAAGYELVELRFILEQNGWVLRVGVDLPLDASVDVGEVPPDRVDLSDCENVSRELSAVLDVDDVIKQAYSLEVTSPGIDRALRTAKHFEHFSGCDAKIQLEVPLVTPTGERRNFRGILRGILGEGSDCKVAIDVDGKRFELPLDGIESARLVPDWDAVMRGKSGHLASAPKPVKPGHRPSQKKQKSSNPSGAQGAGGPSGAQGAGGSND